MLRKFSASEPLAACKIQKGSSRKCLDRPLLSGCSVAHRPLPLQMGLTTYWDIWDILVSLHTGRRWSCVGHLYLGQWISRNTAVTCCQCEGHRARGRLSVSCHVAGNRSRYFMTNIGHLSPQIHLRGRLALWNTEDAALK